MACPLPGQKRKRSLAQRAFHFPECTFQKWSWHTVNEPRRGQLQHQGASPMVEITQMGKDVSPHHSPLPSTPSTQHPLHPAAWGLTQAPKGAFHPRPPALTAPPAFPRLLGTQATLTAASLSLRSGSYTCDDPVYIAGAQ